MDKNNWIKFVKNLFWDIVKNKVSGKTIKEFLKEHHSFAIKEDEVSNWYDISLYSKMDILERFYMGETSGPSYFINGDKTFIEFLEYHPDGHQVADHIKAINKVVDDYTIRISGNDGS